MSTIEQQQYYRQAVIAAKWQREFIQRATAAGAEVFQDSITFATKEQEDAFLKAEGLRDVLNGHESPSTESALNNLRERGEHA